MFPPVLLLFRENPPLAEMLRVPAKILGIRLARLEKVNDET